MEPPDVIPAKAGIQGFAPEAQDPGGELSGLHAPLARPDLSDNIEVLICSSGALRGIKRKKSMSETFSISQLLLFLTALDRDVQIVVRKKPKSRARARLLVASG